MKDGDSRTCGVCGEHHPNPVSHGDCEVECSAIPGWSFTGDLEFDAEGNEYEVIKGDGPKIEEPPFEISSHVYGCAGDWDVYLYVWWKDEMVDRTETIEHVPGAVEATNIAQNALGACIPSALDSLREIEGDHERFVTAAELVYRQGCKLAKAVKRRREKKLCRQALQATNLALAEIEKSRKAASAGKPVHPDV